jgi:hypothetical protein
MNRSARILRLLFAVGLLAACAAAEPAGPTISYQLTPKNFDSCSAAQLLVTADLPSAYGKVDVKFVAPPGFAAEPSSLKFDQPGKTILAVTIRRTGDVPTGEFSLLAHAAAQPSGTGPALATDQVVTLSYTRRLAVRFYFLLGAIGFVVGYLLRIVTAVLKKVPAPNPAPGDGSAADGPITVFVKQHYYLVDFLVSLVLALVVLLYLMKDGRPPDSAIAWSGALLTGIGLGFLTNNDLLAKIKM